jgi:two-component system, NarL family, invasion response regulator UvrY
MKPLVVSVLVVDDHAVVRAGLKSILNEQSDISVVSEASSVDEAKHLIHTKKFQVVVLDVALGRESGWEVLRYVRSRTDRIGVLVLSAFREEQYAVQALRSGADGFLNKESAPDQLVFAVRRIANGHKYVSPDLADRLARNLGEATIAPLDSLSEREFEVLRMIAAGQSLTVIAENLHVSPKTVTTYRARLLEKLELDNNAALTRFAIDHKLLDH